MNQSIDSLIDFETGSKNMKSIILKKIQEMKKQVPDLKNNLYIVGFLDALFELEKNLNENSDN